MATYEKLQKSNRSKILVAGDSGAGKTGLLSTLANAGYRTCIIDLDDGLDVLDAYLAPKGRENVHFMTLHDDEAPTGRSAWAKFSSLVINGWKDDEEDLGKIQDWGTDTVLSIDTGTFLGKAAIRDIYRRKKKPLESQVEISEWGEASRMVEQRLATLASRATSCHLVMNCHIRSYEDDMGRTRWWPSVVASTLSREVGRYFNTALRIDTKMIGGKPKKLLRTVSDSKMDLKSTRPDLFEVEEEFDLASIIERENS